MADKALTAPQDDAPRHSVVYFIQVGRDGPIKIGVGFSARARLRALQTAHYQTLYLLTWTEGTRVLEGQYHKQFREHHIRGEWFRPALPLKIEIARLQVIRGCLNDPPMDDSEIEFWTRGLADTDRTLERAIEVRMAVE